jgi:acyl-coenzyme A thioesterase PaaI-like protein
VCEGRVIHRGRTLAVSEATLKDGNGKLLAFGTETCSIFPAENLSGRAGA